MKPLRNNQSAMTPPDSTLQFTPQAPAPSSRSFKPLLQAAPRNRAAQPPLGVLYLIGLIPRAGLQADYRAEFWSMFWTQLCQGRLENVFQIAMVTISSITLATASPTALTPLITPTASDRNQLVRDDCHR